MAFDKKLFACVARATNSIYFYVSADTLEAIETANYFTGATGNTNITGQLKVGDIIFVNSTAATGGGFGILRVTVVTQSTGLITVAAVTLGSTASSST